MGMEMEQNVPVAQRVHTRVRLPPDLHRRVTERADTAGVPLGTYMAMLIQLAIEHWDRINPDSTELDAQDRHLDELRAHQDGTRHWHRIDNRKKENAVRTWFDQGREMGEFTCSCGKLVTRTVVK